MNSFHLCVGLCTCGTVCALYSFFALLVELGHSSVSPQSCCVVGVKGSVSVLSGGGDVARCVVECKCSGGGCCCCASKQCGQMHSFAIDSTLDAYLDAIVY
jgi:hypothetical protein